MSGRFVMVDCHSRLAAGRGAAGGVSASVFYFMAGLIVLTMAGCERFRHEKYSCPSNALGIREVTISDASAGASMTLLMRGTESQITIGAATDDEIVATSGTRVMTIDRKTGRIKVITDNKAVFMTCEKSLFTM